MMEGPNGAKWWTHSTYPTNIGAEKTTGATLHGPSYQTSSKNYDKGT
jgi:hypothetical protein